jgi:hypothetical protein
MLNEVIYRLRSGWPGIAAVVNVLHLYTVNVLDSAALLCYVLVRLYLEKRPTLQPDSARAGILLWLGTAKFLSQGTAKLFVNRQKVAILS